MDNLISLEDADAIAQHARFVSEVQRQVNHANELIEALQSDERAEVEVSFSTAFKQGHYHCQVSAASAICLLRESIEIKQQYIKTLSEWLRSALNE